MRNAKAAKGKPMNASDIETIRELVKHSCREKLNSIMRMSLSSDVDGTQHLLQDRLSEFMEQNAINNTRNLVDVEVRQTKLPRKLKKAHKKQRIIDMTVTYREAIPTMKLTINIDSNETKIETT